MCVCWKVKLPLISKMTALKKVRRLTMKVIKKDIERKYLLLVLDFWEAEILGYDVIKKIDVSGTYYKLILKEIEAHILEVFGEVFRYGIKTYIDEDKGLFYYEIKPYEERLDEFIIEEMLRNQSTIKFFYPEGIQ